VRHCHILAYSLSRSSYVAGRAVALKGTTDCYVVVAVYRLDVTVPKDT